MTISYRTRYGDTIKNGSSAARSTSGTLQLSATCPTWSAWYKRRMGCTLRTACGLARARNQLSTSFSSGERSSEASGQIWTWSCYTTRMQMTSDSPFRQKKISSETYWSRSPRFLLATLCSAAGHSQLSSDEWTHSSLLPALVQRRRCWKKGVVSEGLFLLVISNDWKIYLQMYSRWWFNRYRLMVIIKS